MVGNSKPLRMIVEHLRSLGADKIDVITGKHFKVRFRFKNRKHCLTISGSPRDEGSCFKANCHLIKKMIGENNGKTG